MKTVFLNPDFTILMITTIPNRDIHKVLMETAELVSLIKKDGTKFKAWKTDGITVWGLSDRVEIRIPTGCYVYEE